MKEKIRNLKNNFKEYQENQPIFMLFAVVLILLLAFGVYSQLKLRADMQKQKSEFESKVTQLEDTISRLEAELSISQEENQELSSILSEEQRRVYELERDGRRQEREIEDLTKLTTIDPELLKKYSRVYFLSENYEPREIEEVDEEYIYEEGRTFEILSDIVPFFEDMLEDAKDDDVEIYVGSAYRSFEIQKNLKQRNVITYGATTANSFSAEQGYSEHQLGTTIDFTTPSLGGGLSGFQNTDAYEWLLENAYKYGFALSYPEDNDHYIYEPWHWRFVGRELAEDLHRDEKYFYEVDQRELDEYLLDIFE